MLTERLSQALAIAIEAHNSQVRKGTSVPYIAHPMAVASIALEYGADEDQAMAALLHDAVEDGGAEYAQIIRNNFGDRVADIVDGCTDGVPDQNGKKTVPWKIRKESYLSHLGSCSDDVLLVSGSDKLHNARAIVSDLQNIGLTVFDRFSSTKEDTLWYYQSLSDIFKQRNAPTAKVLSETVAQMQALSK